MEKKWTFRAAQKDTNGPCEREGGALLERKIFHKSDGCVTTLNYFASIGVNVLLFWPFLCLRLKMREMQQQAALRLRSS